jgi:hypothetical protein
MKKGHRIRKFANDPMDFTELSRLASSHAEARILQVAVSLNLFDLLQDRGLDAPTIAAGLKTDPRATELFLNALVAMDLLQKENAIYSLVLVSRTYLLRSSATYFGGMIQFESSLWNAWGELENSIRSGKSARAADMYQQDPTDTERFIRAMHSLVAARGDAEVLAEALDLTRVSELLDVGSGPGTYPIAFCRRYPRLQVTIFDLPGTLNITRPFIRAANFEDRIALAEGDYRVDPIPGKYQLIFLSNIIHSESSEENRRLFSKLYHSLDKSGKIIIKDQIWAEDRTHPAVGAVFSMLMLLTTNAGRCYSLNEVRDWLTAAGFKNIREVSLPPPLTSSLVVGEKP